MKRLIFISALLALMTTACSLPGRIARVMTNAPSNAWVKMGQCEAHSWGGEGAIACPVSRLGSEVTNMLVIPNRRPRQQEAINKTASGGSFRMKAVIYQNPEDRSSLLSVRSSIVKNINTRDYLVPTELNGKKT